MAKGKELYVTIVAQTKGGKANLSWKKSKLFHLNNDTASS
mgnify:CR=1 FL=1